MHCLRRREESRRRRVLVIRSGALGDFVLTLPVLVRLRQIHSGAELVLVARRSRGRLALACGLADDLIDEDREEVVSLYAGRADPACRRGGFDTVVSFVQSVKLRAGLLRSGCAEYLAVAPRPPATGGTNAADHLMSVLRPLGAVKPAIPQLRLPENEVERARGRLAKSGLCPGRFVMLSPGSGGVDKNWPIDRFAEVARGARRSLGLGVAVVAGPAEEERLGGRLFAAFGPATAFFVSDPPLETAALASQSACFIGNDSGLTHLAAASGTRVIAIFGPTDPAVWAPRGPDTSVLRSDCGRLSRILPDTVLDRVAELVVQ